MGTIMEEVGTSQNGDEEWNTVRGIHMCEVFHMHADCRTEAHYVAWLTDENKLWFEYLLVYAHAHAHARAHAFNKCQF